MPTTTDEQLMQIEQHGYNKDYIAGRKRVQREAQSLLDEYYLALLPVAMTVEGWSIGDKKINTGDDRCELASRWAKHALKHRPKV